MTSDETPGASAPLQFDRVQTGKPEAGPAAAERGGVVCQSCGKAIRTTYFSLGDASICGLCRASFEESSEKAQSWGTFFKASIFGFVAALVGAVIYYGVIAITNLEIGLVAILIGYMVGFSVRKGTSGFGGRRYQFLALCLTYLAISLAYVPLAFQAAEDDDEPAEVAATRMDLATPATASEPTPEAEPVADELSDEADEAAVPMGPITPGGFLGALGALAVVFLGLPIIAIVYSMPSGLISALIIGFGLHQAWRMTAEIPMEVTGPYKVGTAPTSA